MTVLRAAGVHKRFGGVRALRGADLEVAAGEVHSLVGANGSGKSTLLGILSGQLMPDAGTIELNGRRVRFADPTQALAAGIATVTQETTLVPELSAGENVLLGPRKPRGRLGAIDWRASRRRAQELLDRLDADFSPDMPVAELRPDQQQLVEIARALSMEARVLILDEPTSALTDAEVEALFGVVRSLTGEGLTTIFVSHRMNELFAISDRVTILRDGCTVGSGAIGDYDADALIEAMVGRKPTPLEPSAVERAAGARPVLRVEGLHVPGVVDHASLELGAGEVVGLAGLAGAGRSELLDALFGLRQRAHGTVEVDGRRLARADPGAAIAHGLAYVPGDRKSLGLVLDMTLKENLMMAETAGSWRLRNLRRPYERSRTATALERFGIVASSGDAPCSTLSGGNQQKVVLAKWLGTRPKALLMDEPTRGVDVGAKNEIYRLLDEARSVGVGVLVSSSETPELLLLCDRILVMFRGRIVAALDRVQASEAEITRYAMGHL